MACTFFTFSEWKKTFSCTWVRPKGKRTFTMHIQFSFFFLRDNRLNRSVSIKKNRIDTIFVRFSLKRIDWKLSNWFSFLSFLNELIVIDVNKFSQKFACEYRFVHAIVYLKYFFPFKLHRKKRRREKNGKMNFLFENIVSLWAFNFHVSYFMPYSRYTFTRRIHTFIFIFILSHSTARVWIFILRSYRNYIVNDVGVNQKNKLTAIVF